MAYGNVRREAYTAGSEATLLSLENYNDGAFVVGFAGAAPEAPPWRGVTGRPGSRERCRAVDGPPGNLGDPVPSVRGTGWKGNASEINPDPGPASGLHDAGSVKSGNEPQQDTHGTGRRNNKPKGCGIGSRSALIVPVKAGNRGHRDPVKESGASHEQNRRRETHGDVELRKRVNGDVR